jgi:hypothetical protein
MSENVNNPAEVGGNGGNLLGVAKHTESDLKLLSRAIRRRWPVPEKTMAAAIQRLETIVEKATVTVMTQDGPMSLDAPADANAVRAAAVLAQMESQNQADDHLADKNSRIDAGKPTELGGVVFSTPLTEGVYEERKERDALPQADDRRQLPAAD